MRRRLLFAEEEDERRELMKKHRHTKTEKKAFRLRGGFRERDRPTLKSDTRTDDEEVEESWWSHWGVQKGTVRIWPITETRCSETAPPCITHTARRQKWIELALSICPFFSKRKAPSLFLWSKSNVREKKKRKHAWLIVAFSFSTRIQSFYCDYIFALLWTLNRLIAEDERNVEFVWTYVGVDLNSHFLQFFPLSIWEIHSNRYRYAVTHPHYTHTPSFLCPSRPPVTFALLFPCSRPPPSFTLHYRTAFI